MKRVFLVGLVTIGVACLLVIRSCSSNTAPCVFDAIINKTAPANIIAENADVIVFESINPRYPSHWLIIPKKHIPNLKSAHREDGPLLGKLLMAAAALGKQLEEPKAFNLALNEGKEAGQTVPHIHLHFYSNSKLATNSPKI